MSNTESTIFSGPLFVVGMPRSGTKLLREVLLRNPRLKIPRLETHFFPELVQYVERRNGRLNSQSEFAELYRWAQRFQYFKYARRRNEVLTCDDWHRSCPNMTAAGIFEGLIRHDTAAPLGSNLIWGDKSPSYLTYIAPLAKHFPSARIIHIVRDARDQVLSVRRTWGKDVLRAAQRWNDDVDEALRQAEAIPNQCLLVRYEDLLADSAATVEKVCHFLDLEFQESMLTLDRHAESSGVGRGQKTILRNNTAKYLSGFNEAELRDIEAITGRVLVRLGYPLVQERQPLRLSSASMSLRRIRDALSLAKTRSNIPGWNWLTAIRFYFRS